MGKEWVRDKVLSELIRGAKLSFWQRIQEKGLGHWGVAPASSVLRHATSDAV